MPDSRGSSESSSGCSLKSEARITGFNRVQREAWVEIHRDELQHDRDLLQSGQPPITIEPLREAMPHPIHRVARFDIVAPYTLAVAFTDGTAQRINFRPVLHGTLFGPLQDLATFNAVTLDSETGTLIWPNGADFDPATLHDWPAVCDELAARARTWADATPDEPRANQRMAPTRR